MPTHRVPPAKLARLDQENQQRAEAVQLYAPLLEGLDPAAEQLRASLEK